MSRLRRLTVMLGCLILLNSSLSIATRSEGSATSFSVHHFDSSQKSIARLFYYTPALVLANFLPPPSTSGAACAQHEKRPRRSLRGQHHSGTWEHQKGKARARETVAPACRAGAGETKFEETKADRRNLFELLTSEHEAHRQRASEILVRYVTHLLSASQHRHYGLIHYLHQPHGRALVEEAVQHFVTLVPRMRSQEQMIRSFGHLIRSIQKKLAAKPISNKRKAWKNTREDRRLKFVKEAYLDPEEETPESKTEATERYRVPPETKREWDTYPDSSAPAPPRRQPSQKLLLTCSTNPSDGKMNRTIQILRRMTNNCN